MNPGPLAPTPGQTANRGKDPGACPCHPKGPHPSQLALPLPTALPRGVQRAAEEVGAEFPIPGKVKSHRGPSTSPAAQFLPSTGGHSCPPMSGNQGAGPGHGLGRSRPLGIAISVQDPQASWLLPPSWCPQSMDAAQEGPHPGQSEVPCATLREMFPVLGREPDSCQVPRN